MVFESTLPVQAIHGDASISNLLRAGGRLLWNDLEDVCRGPVLWDVAGLVVEARALGRSEEYVAGVLRAYGGQDLDELRDFMEAHTLYTTIWHAASAS
ncbi:MAG TPA: phosphotransferase [Gaiellales bacterium]